MYELTEQEVEMYAAFDGQANILMRNGLFSIEEVRSYLEKYPFDEYARYKALYYRGIGPVRYKKILELLAIADEP